MAPAEKAGEEDDDDGGSHSSSDCHTLSPPDSSGTNFYTAFILIKRNELQSVIIMYVFVLCISTILIITGLLLQHFLLPPFYKPILVFDYIDIHLFFVLETNH